MNLYPFRLLITFCLILFAPSTLIWGKTEFSVQQLTTVDGLANNTVRHIMQDSHGDFWIATSNGVSRYRNGQFTNYYPSTDPRVLGLVDQRVKHIQEDSLGLIWMSTRLGYSCYDPQKEAFIDYNKLGVPTPAPFKQSIHKLRDSKGRQWRISEREGLYIDHRDHSTEHYTSDNCPIPTNALKCIYLDHEGTIWIGTENLGISRLTVFENYGMQIVDEGTDIRMVSLSAEGKLVAGDRRGNLWCYDDSLSLHSQHRHFPHNVYCYCKDSLGHIWTGTKGGGLLQDGQVLDTTLYKDIYALHYRPGDHRLWIGTFGMGLYHYDLNRHTLSSPLLAEAYGSSFVRCLLRDEKGYLWVATSDGIYVLRTEPKLEILDHICRGDGRLHSDEIRTIFRDSRNRIYIAETGVGFAIYDQGNITHYTKADSLVNDMVQCFVEDHNGDVWITTEFGISRFTPQDDRFTNYFLSKNMLTNVFAENCGVLLDDGRVALGSRNGMVVIRPSSYRERNVEEEIQIEDITLAGRPLLERNIRYIIRQWWRSPWFIAIIFLLVVCALGTYVYAIRRRNRYHNAIRDLNRSKSRLVNEKREMAAAQESLQNEKQLMQRDIVLRRERNLNEQEQAFIQRVEEIVQEQIANPDFSADDYAQQMGMGRTLFFREMKEVTGYTPKDYIRKVRLHRAADLLCTTQMSISEIALQVGITDPLYLSRIFRTEYNCSPSDWRKRSLASVDKSEDEPD